MAAHRLARQKMMERTAYKFKPFQENDLVYVHGYVDGAMKSR